MTTLLKRQVQGKRRVARRVDPHGFESVGDILRRMRGESERQMTASFSPTLSLRIDHLLDAEQRSIEEGRE